MSETAAKTHEPAGYQGEDLSSDEAIESAALAGAAAIQRLVEERNELRHRLEEQRREMAAVRALNEDLRQRLLTIHQHYLEMAKRVVGDLEQVDGTIREVTQEAFEGPLQRTRPQASDSLARRLAEADQQDRPRSNGSAQPKA
jgi:predicted  nucleic acid-binding Zn-ribbon protein